MKFITLIAVAATTVAAYDDIFIGEGCGDRYGMEVCGGYRHNDGSTNANVVVCNDNHVWAVRQECDHRSCCWDKPEGGAYCACTP